MIKVKYYLRGRIFEKEISDLNEYGFAGYQWNNALSVIGDCLDGYPRVYTNKEALEILSNELADVGGNDEFLENTIEMLKQKNGFFFIAMGENQLFDDESLWIPANDKEDACRIALLDLKFSEGRILDLVEI